MAKKQKIKYDDLAYVNVAKMLDCAAACMEQYTTHWMQSKFQKKYRRLIKETLKLSQEALDISPFNIDYE